jgi:hypothetical protein
MPLLAIDLILDDRGPANRSMLRAVLSGKLNLTRKGAIKQKRFSEEQIAFVLRQAESGTTIEEICCKEIRPRDRQKLLRLAKASLLSARAPRRPRFTSAGSQLVWKFREQFSFRDTECAGGRNIRRAQCGHRPHKAPVGIAEIRDAALLCRQRRQRALKRLHARSDRFPLSTRARPRAASTDSFGFRHFKPFEFGVLSFLTA